MHLRPQHGLLTFALLAWFGTAVASAQTDLGPQPQQSMGTLAVKGTQGTEGGPSPAGDAVELHLFQGEEVALRLDAVLDGNGFAMFTSIPLSTPLRPLVRIMHAGVVYQEVGPTLDASKPTASMDVLVHETKLDEPAWDIVLRRVFAIPSKKEVAVSEMLVVESAGDYTWLGGPLDEREQRTAVTVSLPTAARDIQLDSGFHGWCCTKFDGALLEVQMPLMPGRATFHYSYKIPIDDGAADISVSGPVPTRGLEFLVPDTGLDMRTDGLTAAGIATGEQGPMRVFQREAQPAQQRCGLTLVGLATDLPPMAPATAPNLGLRIGAGVTLGVGLATVLFFIFARKPKPRHA